MGTPRTAMRTPSCLLFTCLLAGLRVSLPTGEEHWLGSPGCRGALSPGGGRGGERFMGIGLHNLGLRGGGFKKSRGPRQLHNYVPKQKRAGENPLQVNKPHRMRKKEKDRTKAETKMKNVLASVKMEDREKLYDAGAIDAPFHSDKFRSRAARVKTGDISDLSEFDDEAVVKEVVDVKRKRKDRDSKEWRGRRVGRAGPTEDEQMGAAAGTENTGLGGDPADSHAGYSGGVAAMEDEEELKLPEQKKVSSMEKLSEGLAKGDVVEYRDAQGAWVRAEVMSVDRGIAPISVSVQLSGGHVRETVLERLRAIARPPPPASSCLASFRGPRGFDAGVAPPREQVSAARSVDPTERFFDRARGGILNPGLRAAMLLPRLSSSDAMDHGTAEAPSAPKGEDGLLGGGDVRFSAAALARAGGGKAADEKRERDKELRGVAPKAGGKQAVGQPRVRTADASARKDHRYRRYGR
ncbi:hypothetical protein T484DRAFT_2016478 [Baffinella frigidus]|nr:hypothetical protein T484DRAFT_2016478 [Cryptophyta sp. CCMP2293]